MTNPYAEEYFRDHVPYDLSLHERIRGLATALQTSIDSVVAGDTIVEPAPQRALLEPLQAQAGLMPTSIVLERRRTDFAEFCWYTPLTGDGKEWHRWYFTNRFNAGQLGMSCMIVCTLAYLYASTALALPAANISTGTTATAATETQTPASATDVGSWTAPATTNGVTTVSWPTTAGVGATRTYTIDNSSGTKGRVVLRGTKNSSNGGIAKITVKLNGTEIAESLYLCPNVSGEHVVNYRDQQSTTGGLLHAPAADGIGAGTITVLIEESATNPVGGRLYDAGILCYNGVPTTGTAGLYGLAEVNSSANLMTHAGTEVVYQVTNSTRVSWRYRTQTVSGIAKFKLYDNSGVEVATYSATSVDTYNAAGATDKSIEVARGLPRATYWLHVKIDKTKNAAATRYALYDLAALGTDETTAGVIGVDAFDTNGVPSNPGNSADFGSAILMGPSNMEFAIQARDASQPSGVEKFLSGPAHGFETAPSLAFYIDGVDQTSAYNALAVGGTLVGQVGRVVGTTNLKSPTTTQTTPPTTSVVLNALTTIANLTYDMNFSSAGYQFRGTNAWVSNVVVYRDYGLILQMSSRKAGSKGAGGGSDLLAVDTAADYNLNTYNDSQFVLSRSAAAFAFANDGYTSVARLLNQPELNDLFSDLVSTTLFGNFNSYSTGYNKAYSDVMPNKSGGTAITSGTRGYTKKILFRSFKGPQMRVSLGL